MDIVSTIRSIVEIGQQIKKAYEARKEVEGKCGDIYKLIDTMAPVLQAVNAMRLPKNKMQTFVKSLSALAETMKEARTFAMDYLKCSVGSGAAIGLLNLGSQMMSAEGDLSVRESNVPLCVAVQKIMRLQELEAIKAKLQASWDLFNDCMKATLTIQQLEGPATPAKLITQPAAREFWEKYFQTVIAATVSTRVTPICLSIMPRRRWQTF
jgi:hypothetical protein